MSGSVRSDVPRELREFAEVAGCRAAWRGAHARVLTAELRGRTGAVLGLRRDILTTQRRAVRRGRASGWLISMTLRAKRRSA